MANLDSLFADIGANPAGGSNLDALFSDIGSQPAADVTPATAGGPAKITVRPQGFVENATAPITNIPSTYSDIIRNALTSMSGGLEQARSGVANYGSENNGLENAISGIQQGRDIGYAVERAGEEAPPKPQGTITDRLKSIGNILGGIGKTAAGAAEYVSAPIIAPFRSIVSQPVENVTGLPKEYTEFAAGLAAPLPKAIPGFAKAPETFVPPNPAAPTVAALKTAGATLRQQPEVTGTVLNNPARPRLADEIRHDFAVERVSDEAAQRVLGRVTAFEKRGGMASVDDIDALRKQIGEIQPVKDATGGVTNKPELRAAEIARKRIDEFLPSVTPEETFTGNPAKAQATLAEARGNEAAAFRAETINRKQFRAELRAAAANSGKNLSNTMRQRIADILLDPAQLRGYSAQERALMERIVRGGTAENALRYAGNFLGGGGGLGALVTTAEGFRALGPVGALAAIPGAALKSLSNVMTARNIERLNEAIRSNSPLGRQMTTPIEDWGRAHEAFQAAPTAQGFARLTLAARNLSNNLLDAGIKVAPDRLINFERAVPAGAQEQQ